MVLIRNNKAALCGFCFFNYSCYAAKFSKREEEVLNESRLSIKAIYSANLLADDGF